MRFFLNQRVRVLMSRPCARRRLGTVRQLRKDGSAFVELDRPLAPSAERLFPKLPERANWVLVEAEGAQGVTEQGSRVKQAMAPARGTAMVTTPSSRSKDSRAAGARMKEALAGQ